METIAIDRPRDGVARITLQRPEKLNAVNEPMRTELTDALDTIDRPVVLVRGAANTFCAGEDIDEIPADRSGQIAHSGSFIDLLQAMRESDAVLVAYVEGYAMGGGMFLAAACDLRIAHADATFGVPVLELGTAPAAGGTKLLIDLLGVGRVKDLVLTAGRLNAERAKEEGFVERVVADEGDALTVVSTIAAYDNEAVRNAKAYITKCAEADSLAEVKAFEPEFL
jgi:enoyl-CoA hydratase/carnithine racemase